MSSDCIAVAENCVSKQKNADWTSLTDTSSSNTTRWLASRMIRGLKKSILEKMIKPVSTNRDLMQGSTITRGLSKSGTMRRQRIPKVRSYNRAVWVIGSVRAHVVLVGIPRRWSCDKSDGVNMLYQCETAKVSTYTAWEDTKAELTEARIYEARVNVMISATGRQNVFRTVPEVRFGTVTPLILNGIKELKRPSNQIVVFYKTKSFSFRP